MSDEAVRELERAAEAGTLDPVRALVELDRRGLLSRGEELVRRGNVMSGRGYLPVRRAVEVMIASRDSEWQALRRAAGRGLGPGHWGTSGIAAFTDGFCQGYVFGSEKTDTTIGELRRSVPVVHVFERARRACETWLFGPPEPLATMQEWLRRTAGFALPMEAVVQDWSRSNYSQARAYDLALGPRRRSAFSMLDQIDGGLEAHDFDRLLSRATARSVGGASFFRQFQPETLEVSIGRPAKPRAERLREKKAERARAARAKTQANVRRKPPRTL